MPVTSKNGRIPPIKHGGVGRQQQQQQPFIRWAWMLAEWGMPSTSAKNGCRTPAPYRVGGLGSTTT